jgi:hypothetical protein
MVGIKDKISLQEFLTGLGVLVFSNLSAQLPTYTIDNSFNSGELFKSAKSVKDFHFLEDGRILVGGGYSNDQVSGLAMIFDDGEWDDSFYTFEGSSVLEIIALEDGYVYPSIYGFNKVFLDGIPYSQVHQDFWSDYFEGGTNNPYNLQRAWDIYKQENGDLIIAGAIGTDTLQPGILRGLARIHADGTHDPTFPEIDIMPNIPGAAIRKIHKAPDGSWYVSGGFNGLNGHETNHVAKLTPDFQVDTDFVSPFMYDGPASYNEDIMLVDSQSRIWVSGHDMRLLENPLDTIQIIRLMPDGSVDENFIPRKLENNYPDFWVPSPSHAFCARELQSHPGNYFIYGSFSHFEYTNQPAITVVNDAGIIQEHFFQDMGATINEFVEGDTPRMPRIDVVEELDNGDLLIGGGFTEFMGQEIYSLVKLNPGFLSTEQKDNEEHFELYPNPAKDFLNVTFSSIGFMNAQILDARGKLMHSIKLDNSPQSIDITGFNSGMYFMILQNTFMKYSAQKFVIR